MFVLALLVAIVWLLRLRRRARLVPIDAHMVTFRIVGALTIGLFGAFAILLVNLPPGPIAILFSSPCWRWACGLHGGEVARVQRSQLGGVAHSAAGTDGRTPPPRRRRIRRSQGGQQRGPADVEPVVRPPYRARSLQFALGCVGLALCVVGASFAVMAAKEEWVPPPELSIAMEQGLSSSR